LNGTKSCVIATERNDAEITLDAIHKIVEGVGKTYEITITVLPEYKEDYSRKIDEMLGSFALK
jgi:pyruvate-formate lyase-activating enzyme